MLDLWFYGTFWDKVYIVFAIIVIVNMVRALKTFFTDNSKHRLESIIKAQKNGNCVIGKLTCLTKEGKSPDVYYCAEYMYVVNDKRYFVTYKIKPSTTAETSKEIINADILASSIQKYIMLFYSPTYPEIVSCKAEVFASKEAFSQTSTSKTSIYRDVDRDWDSAIDLVRY